MAVDLLSVLYESLGLFPSERERVMLALAGAHGRESVTKYLLDEYILSNHIKTQEDKRRMIRAVAQSGGLVSAQWAFKFLYHKSTKVEPSSRDSGNQVSSPGGRLRLGQLVREVGSKLFDITLVDMAKKIREKHPETVLAADIQQMEESIRANQEWVETFGQKLCTFLLTATKNKDKEPQIIGSPSSSSKDK